MKGFIIFLAFAGWIDVVACVQNLVVVAGTTELAAYVVRFGLESNKVRANPRIDHTYMVVWLESVFRSPFWIHRYSDSDPGIHRCPTSL